MSDGLIFSANITGEILVGKPLFVDKFLQVPSQIKTDRPFILS